MSCCTEFLRRCSPSLFAALFESARYKYFVQSRSIDEFYKTLRQMVYLRTL